MLKSYRESMNDLRFTREEKNSMVDGLMAAMESPKPKHKVLPLRRMVAVGAAAALVLALGVGAAATGVLKSAGEAFAAGLTLLDGTECLPAELICSQKPDECTVVLHEGMFHQIKRMFEALDNNVIFLKRIAIGGVKLDNNLPYGGVRELKSDEVKALTSAE